MKLSELFGWFFNYLIPIYKETPKFSLAFGGPEGVLMSQCGKAPAIRAIEEVKTTVKLSGKACAAAEGRVIAKKGSFRKQTLKDAWNKAEDGTLPNTKLCPTCKKNVKGNPNNGEKRVVLMVGMQAIIRHGLIETMME